MVPSCETREDDWYARELAVLRLNRLAVQYSALAVEDERCADDIIGYDSVGLPT